MRIESNPLLQRLRDGRFLVPLLASGLLSVVQVSQRRLTGPPALFLASAWTLYYLGR